MRVTFALAICSQFICSVFAAHAVTIETVPIGNAGNTGELQSTGTGYKGTFGAVAYNYRIGKYEVTNSQYVSFLNGVATSDPYQLYNLRMTSDTDGGIIRNGSPGSFTYAVKPDSIGNGPGGADGDDYTYGDKPVNYVSWYDAIRFANWLHNGQGDGDTETGAYMVLGGTPIPSNDHSITREPAANWFLPSWDEWYKSAYHKNDGVTENYWDYPTSTDIAPNNNLPSSDTGNSANSFAGDYTTGNSSFPMTNVGAYLLSEGPYGTFDQGGNVWERIETLIGSSVRGARGGSSLFLSEGMAASYGHTLGPGTESSGSGFRVASIPEPTTYALALAALCLTWRRRR